MKGCADPAPYQLQTQWITVRKKPYTELGIKRLPCIRCGNKSSFQWQICADHRNYRPICKKCDIELNRMVLEFMNHPEAENLTAKYAEKRG